MLVLLVVATAYQYSSTVIGGQELEVTFQKTNKLLTNITQALSDPFTHEETAVPNPIAAAKLEDVDESSEGETFRDPESRGARGDTICGAKHLGCFTRSKREGEWQAIEGSRPMVMAQACVDMCSRPQHNISTFVGIRNRTCMCTDDPHEVIGGSNKRPGACDGPQGVDLYQTTRSCSSVPSNDSELADYKLGCFRIPSGGDGFVSAIDGRSSASACFQACEQRRHSIALFTGAGACACGQLTSGFGLESRIDDARCPAADAARAYVTRAYDLRCSEVRFIWKPKKRKVMLVSAPSSGNTWLRYLVEKSTGFFTGSLYVDQMIYKKGFLGETGSSGLLIKDHMLPQEKPDGNFGAYVFLVRDPYAAFIGNFHLESSKKHTVAVNPERFRTDFQLFYNETNVAYISAQLASFNKTVYVLYYEELRKVFLKKLVSLPVPYQLYFWLHYWCAPEA